MCLTSESSPSYSKLPPDRKITFPLTHPHSSLIMKDQALHILTASIPGMLPGVLENNCSELWSLERGCGYPILLSPPVWFTMSLCPEPPLCSFIPLCVLVSLPSIYSSQQIPFCSSVPSPFSAHQLFSSQSLSSPSALHFLHSLLLSLKQQEVKRKTNQMFLKMLIRNKSVHMNSANQLSED